MDWIALDRLTGPTGVFSRFPRRCAVDSMVASNW
ncbi:hypothetical protein I3843_03G192700 [Carya illinoinensis]|nr:hypothetical protein I3843_03G192700 [Carya illinoinensis]